MIVLIAAVAMLAQDLFETMKMVAIDRSRPILTGLLDTGMWLCWFASSSIAIGAEALHGWTRHTIAIVVAVSAANFVGCTAGVLLGRRLIKDEA